MKVLKYPFHLLAILTGAAAVAVVLWQVEPSGAHFAAYAGGLFALLAAVDLARRLGLEPKDDPARRDRGETS
ncbi:MAG: hypothetical protein KKG14_06450 [Alphaproteobacteria bacterium]|nr:hypothetical protein [Alphaproteobacteria bacterium]MBU2270324.1 hypothetical protein [Alphaproteobacteria bacterium]MBU2418322.1 hypothetical protein [Alphaproteobacteria bacterium]